MLETKAESKLRVTEVIERYGKCLELISMDPHFKDITVGIYRKGQALTVWTFSQEPGVRGRIRQIRDQLGESGWAGCYREYPRPSPIPVCHLTRKTSQVSPGPGCRKRP